MNKVSIRRRGYRKGKPYDALVNYIRFLGSPGSYFELPTSFNINTDSIEVVFKLDYIDRQARICSPTGSAFGGTIYINGSGNLAFYTGDWFGTTIPASTNKVSFAVDYPNGKWIHAKGDKSQEGTFTKSSTAVSTLPFRICYGTGDSSSPWFRGNIYSFKWWREGVLIHNLIPVRIGTKGYLYDLVTKTLFTNQGSLDCQCGKDIN